MSDGPAESVETSTNASGEVIDLRPCKRKAKAVFGRDHPVRRALAEEPDMLPLEEGLAKLETYLRMLLSLKEGS